MVESVYLKRKELDWCEKHAEKIVEHYGGNGTKGSGSYSHNKISSNIVGVKCEVGMAVYLKKFFDYRDIRRNYIDFKNKKLKGDIMINDHVLEVKGLRHHQWDKFKKMYSSKSIKTLCCRKRYCNMGNRYRR